MGVLVLGSRLLLAAVFLLAGMSMSAQGQGQKSPSCNLSVEQSPTVRGLKLGLQFTDMQKLFWPHGDDALQRIGLRPMNDTGMSEQMIFSSMVYGSEQLKGVSSIKLEFMDDKLAAFTVSYDSSVKWQSSAHFAAAIAEQLHLPTSGWEDKYGYLLRLKCDGFFVETTSDIVPTLKIERNDLQDEIKRRRAEQDQKKRVEFKP